VRISRTCVIIIFDDMLNRFENTISGQFYGHTHRDEFNMFYDENDQQRPVSMVCVLPLRAELVYLDFFFWNYRPT
jgi:hypothetical protein